MVTLDSPGRSRIFPPRMNLGEYHQLIAVGVLGEDEPLELLAGVVAEMAPQGRAHAQVISRLGEELMAKRPVGCRVRVQLPLSLGEDSEPEPDLALVTRQEEQAAPAHPRTALLVVEVAEGSLNRDRTLKSSIYARAGVPEYWIVDVAGQTVEVYRAPDANHGRYLELRRLRAADVLTSDRIPGLVLPIADLFV